MSEYVQHVDEAYYTDTYKGETIPTAQRANLLKRASRDIDSLTYNRIVYKGFENLTEFQQRIVQEAICLHADFLYQFEGYLDMPITGFGAGSTSVSFKSKVTSGPNGIATSTRVLSMLTQTGLSNRLFV